MNFSYPIKLSRYRQGLSIEPGIAFYNIANFSNFGGNAGLPSGLLLNQANAGGVTNTTEGYVNGPNPGIPSDNAMNQFRTARGNGTFNQGAPRTTEFQLKLNF
jgi:hypothetical protein